MSTHVPVLLHEVIDGLAIHDGDTIIDATLGGGGYAVEIAKRLGPSGTLVGIDRDQAAIERVSPLLSHASCAVRLVLESFRNIDTILGDLSLKRVDGVCFDLGLSSFQIEDSGRGFSFLRDEPLHMTFPADPTATPFTAKDIVNRWSEEDIANVIFGYGEERYARRIAKGIVDARHGSTIETTGQLVAIIKNSVPGRYRTGAIHPATRTFQALRIAVNDELNALREGIAKAFEALAPGRRIAVVSFHSLEDRIVKQFFKERASRGAVLVTKKPIIPTENEMRMNPRSRSAKLRIIQK